MDYLRTYIQQTKLTGKTYTKGDVVDVLATYHIGTEDFPLVYLPESKELPTLSFNDEDGEEVYIPANRKVSAYDMDVKFLYSGKKTDFRKDLEGFIDLLYGRNAGAIGSRLVIFDEHVKDGRKDITVKNISSDLFYWMDDEEQVIAEFSVTFRVHDPATKVKITKTTSGGTTTVRTSW